MQLALRPYVTTGIVIAGTSAMVAMPLSIPNSAFSPPSIAIAPTASALTGAIDDFDTIFTNGGKSAQVLLNATGGLPEELSRAFLAAADDPNVLPSLGSAFLYGFLSPAPNAGSVLKDLAATLPAPLGTSLIDAFRALGAIVAHSVPGLPSPIDGFAAMGAVELPHVIDVVTTDLGIAGDKFGEQAAFTAAFIGNVPGEVVDFLHAAAAHPEGIPTLLTNTALGSMTDLGDAVFGPMVCLLEDTLPTPLGGPQGLVVKAVQRFLALMPKPEATAALVSTTNTNTTLTTLDESEENSQDTQKTGGATPSLNLFNPGGSASHDAPGQLEKDDVDVGGVQSSGPRLNVVKVNPLDKSRDEEGVGGNVSAGSGAPRPLAHVVERLVQAPAAIAHTIRDALKPQHSEQATNSASDSGDSNG